MKTIEEKYKEALDKAKRYDEAIIRGSRLWESDTITRENYEYIFPELKESEDEKIRRRIIHALHGDGFLNMEETNKAISWLEKQGESDETKAKTFLINKGYPIDTNGILPTYEEMYNIIREGLEDQCEQKPQGKSALEAINEEKVDNANKVEPKNYNSIDPHFGKSIDKIEPKFHEGDWIVHHGTENIYQVVAVIDNQYQLKYGDNYTVQNCANVDRCARLWDITKDAKAGDVLYSPKSAGVEGIFLIKGWEQVELTGKTLCSSIGYRVEENEIVEGGLGAIWWKGVKDPFFPATKEQRDKLEKAMADAGYTFDFEKKELKKIKDETYIAVNNPDSYKIGFADGEAYVKEQQWKPTDGQMEVLKGLIDDEYVVDAYKGILKGLQEQLKKLRGE